MYFYGKSPDTIKRLVWSMVEIMCLILLAYRIHSEYPVILAANRDEFYDRPTKPMAFWEDHPKILGGRDLKGGGTWLGITRSRRFAAVTNYRESGGPKVNAPSRGFLVSSFLEGDKAPGAYLEEVRAEGEKYSGFNLIAGDSTGLYYYSNRSEEILKLKPGWYGLSNHLLNTPWPKVERGLFLMKNALSLSNLVDPEKLFHLLRDTRIPSDELLPDTGVGIEWERVLSPIFIKSSVYGTRSSSVVLIGRNKNLWAAEQTINPTS